MTPTVQYECYMTPPLARLQAIKCDRGEVYLWNPRLYYEKVFCPLCPGRPQKEITTPHFRKHLEQVHTMEGMILKNFESFGMILIQK